jgi:hypothetical protein
MMFSEHTKLYNPYIDRLEVDPYRGDSVTDPFNFPRFLPIFPDFLERLSHLAPIY